MIQVLVAILVSGFCLWNAWRCFRSFMEINAKHRERMANFKFFSDRWDEEAKVFAECQAKKDVPAINASIRRLNILHARCVQELGHEPKNLIPLIRE